MHGEPMEEAKSRRIFPLRPNARAGSTKLLLLLTLLLFLSVFFLYPMFDLFARSLVGDGGVFTLEQYARVFSTQAYMRLFWNTFEVALYVTAATLIIGYGLAYYMTAARPAVATALMFCT